MADEISFVRMDAGLRDRLPYNYAPIAISEIAGQPRARGRRLFPVNLDPERPRVPTFLVNADTLKDPLSMARELDGIRLRLLDTGPADRWFLGPPSDVPDDIEIPLVLNSDNVVGAARMVAVIVDAGIAFWDSAFRSGAGSRFREIVYLDFDAQGGNNQPGKRLDQTSIADLCKRADAEGPRSVVKHLGQLFPNSAFGPGGAAHADRGWHGTGVADLVAGGLKEDQDDVALFGVELSMSVLRDHDGDALLAVLSVVVEMILAATDSLDHLPLVIVLPFGFVSGPQDETHPAIAAVSQRLANAGRKVDLVVPVGNHLQDRCVACFDPPSPEVPDPARSVLWRLPPDDFSPNALEIVLHGGGKHRTLGIAPPGRELTEIDLQVGDFVSVMRGGHRIGWLYRRPDAAASARVRLDLAGTAWRSPGAPPTPAGDWRITETSGSVVDLYALRDDRDPVDDEAFPRRGAHFADHRYRETDGTGAPLRADAGAGPVRRAGTASMLTTVSGVIAVQADERLGGGPRQQAWYSGNRASSVPWTWSKLVDDGWPSRGVACAANGTAQRVRMSGTSAAAALHARWLLGLGERPQEG
jgi:hypothetical protein